MTSRTNNRVSVSGTVANALRIAADQWRKDAATAAAAGMADMADAFRIDAATVSMVADAIDNDDATVVVR